MSVTIYVEKMTKCSVLFCKNYSNRAPGVSFHRFPIDPARKREWVKAVRREKTWIPTKHTSICSIHFEPECFNHNSKKQRKLFKDAVPTLNFPEFMYCINPPTVHKAVSTVCDWAAPPQVQFTLSDDFLHVVRQDPTGRFLGNAVITTYQLCGHNISHSQGADVFVTETGN